MNIETLIKQQPKFLQTALEKRYYRAVVNKIRDNGQIMQVVDCYGIGMLALNLALVEECRKDIRKRGVDVTVQGDRNIVTKKNSSLEVLKDAQSAIKYYLKEFNMTPASRGKGFETGVKIEDDGFDLV